MKTMTLFKLLNTYSILIPSLQRNYVHGRNDSHAKEVREHFVRSLSECCEGSEKKMNLDIVYGVVDKENNITPIDGQQRLTSLWLSAVYAVNKAQNEGINNRLELLSKLSRFSYKARPLASTFCRWLTSGSNIFQGSDFNAILTQASNSWGSDPTVNAMITTLSLIHEKFENQTRELFKVVIKEQVQFDFSEVEGDATDLYVKINARGKLLTQWENFKGAFSKQLNDTNRKEFDEKIEILSNHYFEKFEKLPDEAFFSLFGRVTHYHRKQTKKENSPSTQSNLEVFANGNDLYVPIEEFNLKETANKIVIQILRMLKWILNENQKSAVLHYWEEEPRKIADILLHPKNGNERDFALFLFEYFSEHKTNADIKLHENNFRPLRLVANILENVERNNEKPFNRIELLKDFLKAPNLYDSEINDSNDRPEQFYEEIVKGTLYKQGDAQNDEGLISLLTKCEKYMHGRVRIAILTTDSCEKWNHTIDLNVIDLIRKRLEALQVRLEMWSKNTEEERINHLKEVIACEPWNIKDQIELSLEDNSLRNILSTRDDVYLQKTYLDGEENQKNMRELWQRDWRENAFKLDNWQYRFIKWHGATGPYYLYERGYQRIPNAIPVSDWRFDLREKITTINNDNWERIDSICMNDGGTRSFAYNGLKIRVYLYPTGIQVKRFSKDGHEEKSTWEEINENWKPEDNFIAIVEKLVSGLTPNSSSSGS